MDWFNRNWVKIIIIAIAIIVIIKVIVLAIALGFARTIIEKMISYI